MSASLHLHCNIQETFYNQDLKENVNNKNKNNHNKKKKKQEVRKENNPWKLNVKN